uniref:PQ loop repeat protein n=1 Tax=viral metagenome TaxID=1070528 RepID=A0A6M3JMA8_9ZZZZ
MANNKKFGNIIGWIGVGFGLGVAPPQLVKIIQTGGVQDISLTTYVFLCLALICYLIHAIHIKSKVFTTAQAINLATNFVILILLIKG